MSDDKKQELIPVVDGEIDGKKQPVVSARKQHAAMGIKNDFTHWIKKRLSDYGFQEGVDYEVLLVKNDEQSHSDSRGGHNKTDYILTLDTAKEIAMVERTEMGRAVRNYFIQCEKKLLNAIADSDSDDELSEEERKQDEEENQILGEAARQRVLFWALEKRDRIYHAGMNRHFLFSITCDIEKSLWRELISDYKAFLKADKKYVLSFSDHLNFIETWEPEFFKQERIRNKAKASEF